MKHKPVKYMKSGAAKYVRVMKTAVTVFMILAIFATMMLLVYSFQGAEAYRPLFISLLVCVIVFSLFVYGFYALHVSMGTVLGIEVTDKVVHLITKRKTFTYDVKRGCVALKVKKNCYIGIFETQDSRDKFLFYRHAPFSKYSDEQFTEEDILQFYHRDFK